MLATNKMPETLIVCWLLIKFREKNARSVYHGLINLNEFISKSKYLECNFFQTKASSTAVDTEQNDNCIIINYYNNKKNVIEDDVARCKKF